MHRLKLVFGRDERLKYISHLDLMRLWERVFRRADLPLAYSEGFNPHPKIALAAPLAVGMVSTCELMDIYLAEAVPVADFEDRLKAQLPPGLWLVSAGESEPQAPSLASALRFAEYEVSLEAAYPAEELKKRVALLLAAETLPRERVRDKQVKRYDLRPLVDDLSVIEKADSPPALWMRLRASSGATGRPEEVVAALGFEGASRTIRRVGLIDYEIS